MSLLAKCFVLVNLLLVASAVPIHDVTEIAEEPLSITLNRVVSPEVSSKLMRDGGFIGDLILGQRRGGESTYKNTVQLRNPSPNVVSVPFNFSVENGIIHYVNIMNRGGNVAAVCDLPYSLGTSKSAFTARVLPYSTATLEIFVAAH